MIALSTDTEVRKREARWRCGPEIRVLLSGEQDEPVQIFWSKSQVLSNTGSEFLKWKNMISTEAVISFLVFNVGKKLNCLGNLSMWTGKRRLWV